MRATELDKKERQLIDLRDRIRELKGNRHWRAWKRI